MDWESKLLSVPADHWIVEQVVALDWYDGPRSGLCALADPLAEFIFEFVDEEHNPDGLDLRIVRLKELPTGSVASFAAELERLGPGPVNKPVWSPIWSFPSEESRRQADDLFKAFENRARPTDLVISTADMVQIQNCWKAKATVATSH
jgi:hypothetical protein